MESVILLLFRVLTVMFAIGMIGCVIVIPVTAYKLFSVWFEKDPAEQQ